jgi:hypothetical protein
MKRKLVAPVEESTGDIAQALAKGLIGTIPIAGSTLAETFGLLLAPPFHKRLLEFLAQVAERINEHEVRLEDAVSREEFVSATRTAAETVLKTHDNLKREMLVNAVAKIGIGVSSLSDDVQQIYLRLIDTLTPMHLKLLILFQNPREYLVRAGAHYEPMISSSIDQLITTAIPELRGKGELSEMLCQDLMGAGLLSRMSTIHVMMSATGAFSSRTTAFGNEFIEFTMRTH